MEHPHTLRPRRRIQSLATQTSPVTPQLDFARPPADHLTVDEYTEWSLAQDWAPTLAKAAPVGAEARRKQAKAGIAMPDGSFPIPDVAHLKSAIKLAKTPQQRAHIMKRAYALNAPFLIPFEWRKKS